MLEVAFKKLLRGNQSNERQGAFEMDVDFTASNGITMILGPSGSGKTTCLRAIAGLVTPDAGRISFGEQLFFDANRKINLPIRQRKVGFVFQDYALFPHLTAAQNIAYGVNAGRIGKHKRAQEWLALLGIEYAARQYPRELSGGENQRVALARALASEPQIMLLDEPLSALDQPTRARLLEEIRVIQQRTAIPFLYVTHNVQEAIEIGNYIVRLKQGRVEEEGQVSEDLRFA